MSLWCAVRKPFSALFKWEHSSRTHIPAIVSCRAFDPYPLLTNCVSKHGQHLIFHHTGSSYRVASLFWPFWSVSESLLTLQNSPPVSTACIPSLQVFNLARDLRAALRHHVPGWAPYRAGQATLCDSRSHLYLLPGKCFHYPVSQQKCYVYSQILIKTLNSTKSHTAPCRLSFFNISPWTAAFFQFPRSPAFSFLVLTGRWKSYIEKWAHPITKTLPKIPKTIPLGLPDCWLHILTTQHLPENVLWAV